MTAPLHAHIQSSTRNAMNPRKSSHTPPPDTSFQSSSDIFSLTDDQLKDCLHFSREIGFGNWGSVWACYTKDTPVKEKVAVKLVHRSKTPTTAARVRSLWNEMKVFRALKNDTHPSIVKFHSFIITPSYALISMEYLPRLIPVEVKEHKAKIWFKSLLGGVDFLHSHGVSHNDIKPANILLSRKNIPVLVDFGFAEKYSDFETDKTAFRSNLAYGTPEYLSPERARGVPHDTRKSDIYSLGITFFEILMGRTPFEEVEGEEFTTTEDLERYWVRTVKGTWLGQWHMSRGAEALVRRMTLPNAELRCNASEALEDSYWFEDGVDSQPSLDMLRRPTTPCHTVVPEVIASHIPETQPTPTLPPGLPTPSTPRVRGKRGDVLTHATASPSNKDSSIRNKHGKTKSTAKSARATAASAASVQVYRDDANTTKPASPALISKRVKAKAAAPHTTALLAEGNGGSKVPTTPLPSTSGATTSRKRRPVSSYTSTGTNKENVSTPKPTYTPSGRGPSTRRATPALQPPSVKPSFKNGESRTSLVDNSSDMPMNTIASHGITDAKVAQQGNRPLMDLTPINGLPKEKQRRDSKPVMEVMREVKASMKKVKDGQKGRGKENVQDASFSTQDTEPIQLSDDTLPQPKRESVAVSSLLRQSLRLSMDRLGRMSTAMGATAKHPSRLSVQELRESFEMVEWASQSSPVINQITRHDLDLENQPNQMSLWIRNVERVVEDARQNFQQGEMISPPALPPLPPRLHQAPSRRGQNQGVQPVVTYQSHRRRATVGGSTCPMVVSQSHDALDALRRRSLEHDGDDDPKHPNKARSHGALLTSAGPLGLRAITPMSMLQSELDQEHQALLVPPNPQRLSSIIDSVQLAAEFTSQPPREVSVVETTLDDRDGSASFINITPPGSPAPTAGRNRSMSSVMLDRLFVVPPPPQAESSTRVNRVNNQNELSATDLEGVYDRFIMATSNVVRLGRGYQSENALNRHSDEGVRAAKSRTPSPSQNSPTPTKLRRRSIFKGLNGEFVMPSTSRKSMDELRSPKHHRAVSQGGGDPSDITMAGRVKKAFQAILSTSSLQVKSIGRTA